MANSRKPSADVPYSVVLLDEIEKAHRDVFNILLQVLDDGRLTDNHGHTVDFSNAIIVMTSNIGSQLIQQITTEGGSEDEMRDALEDTLRTRFLPEFLNRIDETIIFHPLERSEVAKIVDFQIELLAAILQQRGLGLIVTESARRQIAADGYDPNLRSSPGETRDPTIGPKPSGHRNDSKASIQKGAPWKLISKERSIRSSAWKRQKRSLESKENSGPLRAHHS